MSKATGIILAVLFVFNLQIAFAQKQPITGKVTDANTGQPLPGASVKVKSGQAGVITSENGTFNLEVTANSTLIISIIGYADQTYKVGSLTSIDIKMQPSITDLAQITMVGTRTPGRIKTESPVPIDVIRINQVGQTTARMDLTSVLNYAAPSFNYNKQTGSDGADHIDLGTLRGLGPDQTLVLINGKRRHQTAFVALFGTKGRGNSGTDLNAFPEASVDRIEILRDGASAQYGSDAMAGVMNIVLKKDVNHWTVNAGYAGYYDTKYNANKTKATNQYYYGNKLDGGTFSLSVNNGVKLGNNSGFINFSADFLSQQKTYRQVADTNIAANPQAMPLNTGRRAFGDGSVTTGGGMYNMELPTGTGKTVFYSFGGYNYKASDAFAYTRNYSGRPDRFPLDANGNLLFDGSIMRKANDGEIYYNPHIQTSIADASFALGFKGESSNEWKWDISNTLGRNNFHFYGDKTYNASIVGKTTPNHFDDGGFNFLQNTFNIDFSKSFKSLAEGVNIAFGGEVRYERYGIYAGEEASYKGYDTTFGQAPGSQGFPGFSPADVIKANRTNIGAYADVEIGITQEWLIDMALRFENYSDFGFVNTSKIASRLKLSDNFNVRGSLSTGFRAPSLQQINFSNTLTSFSGGQLVQSRIANNNDAIVKLVGIPKLKEETSLNSSFGFTWKPANGLNIAVDGYIVKVKNRVILSGLFSAADNSLPEEFTAKLDSLGVATAQFFSNSVNTTNKGVDIVIDYTKKWGSKSIKVILAGNIQGMSVDKVNTPNKLDDSYVHRKTFFSDREEEFLKASAPKSKFSLGIDYSMDKFSFGTHLTYFGSQRSLGFGWTGLATAANTGGPGDPAISGSFTGIDPYVDLDQYLNADFSGDQVHVVKEIFQYRGKVTTDIYASYKFSKTISLFIGADNLFNVHPDFAAVPGARRQSFDNESGGAWEPVQMGFNGRRLFTKLAFNF
jgi:iron complex outermembrane recepter protein